jgi:hypothetical protein
MAYSSSDQSRALARFAHRILGNTGLLLTRKVAAMREAIFKMLLDAFPVQRRASFSSRLLAVALP